MSQIKDKVQKYMLIKKRKKEKKKRSKKEICYVSMFVCRITESASSLAGSL